MLKLVQWMQDISDQTHGWNEFDHSSREDRVVEEDSILHVQGVQKIAIICEHPVHISLQCAILILLSWYCYLELQWYTHSNLQSQMILIQGTDECYSILYIHVLVTKIKLFQLGLIIFMIQLQIFRLYSQKDLHYGIFVNVKQ